MTNCEKGISVHRHCDWCPLFAFIFLLEKYKRFAQNIIIMRNILTGLLFEMHQSKSPPSNCNLANHPSHRLKTVSKSFRSWDSKAGGDKGRVVIDDTRWSQVRMKAPSGPSVNLPSLLLLLKAKIYLRGTDAEKRKGQLTRKAGKWKEFYPIDPTMDRTCFFRTPDHYLMNVTCSTKWI